MDVKSTSLNGYVDEEIYVLQPQGFEVEGSEHLVCKLKKTWYGLKQAPRLTSIFKTKDFKTTLQIPMCMWK